MRKCVFLFLLFVFVLIIASITEKRDSQASTETAAVENVKQDPILQEKTAMNADRP